MKKIAILLLTCGSFLAYSSNALQRMQDVLSEKNKGVSTDAVIIIKDGTQIFEFYDHEYTPSTKHLSWSMAKTIAGIMIGQAIDEGKLALTDKASKYLPHLKSQATIKDLLQMSSGIYFKEVYLGLPLNSDATKMLYMEGPKTGFTDYVSSLPLRTNAAPGDHFSYSSGDSNLLMEILKVVSKNKKEYDDYPWNKIFKPLGITDVTFEQDTNHTFVGSSYLYLSAPDYIKIGQMIMENGTHHGASIIPKDYFKLMNEVAPGVSLNPLEGTSRTRSYSSQITTNKPIKARGYPSEYKDLPEDALIMIGHQGQLLVASPSQKLIILRLALDKGESFNRKEFFAAASDLIREKGFHLENAGDHGYIEHALEQPNVGKSDFSFKDYLKIPHLIRTFAAKEYCSCLLVVGRSEKACKRDLKVSLPILPSLTVSSDKKTVTAILGNGLFNKISKAEYMGKELGCTLTVSL